MVDDALALGIQHAALNINLGQVIEPEPAPTSLAYVHAGQRFHFNAGYLASLDRQIQPLSAAGVVVSLIVLNREPADPVRRRILLHPQYSPDCPNHISAFNTATAEGRAWLTATLSFLAARWSPSAAAHEQSLIPATPQGVVWNWILGNEVNSHWYWCNRGRIDLPGYAADYYEALRLAAAALDANHPQARLFVSLEHHWNIRYPAGDEDQCFPARAFLEHLASLDASAESRVPWQVAFHPYPENLFEPRSWLDQTAVADWRTTPRLTFRNLEQLPLFLQQPALLLSGEPRHVILSEQGFHTPPGPDGEAIQAAAFCYAWTKLESVAGIDAFILHRHVDHAAEGGLLLGLWTRRDGTSSAPDQRKAIYSVFRAAGTPEQGEAFAPYRQFLPAVAADADAAGSPREPPHGPH